MDTKRTTSNLGHWIDVRQVLDHDKLEQYSGFIYRIRFKDGRYYIGKKAFWRLGWKYYTAKSSGKKRRKRIQRATNWRSYTTSSIQVSKLLSTKTSPNKQTFPRCELLAVFKSKSFVNYAEGATIVISQAYRDRTKGLNGEFERCRCRMKNDPEEDEALTQLEQWLFEEYRK